MKCWLDMEKVEKLISEGYLSKKTHPEYPLYIYNYTQRCQIDWHWTPETIACRGLILDKDDNVIARPFPKFFTPEQYENFNSPELKELFGVIYETMYDGPFDMMDKADGSLFILTTYEGKLVGATRGSFTSEQAIKGMKLANGQFTADDIPENTTRLFEVIYPENRIVVDYGKQERLIPLDLIDNRTGKSVAWSDDTVVYPFIERIHDLDTIPLLKSRIKDGKEGFVLRFVNTDFRVKIKSDEYLRLHRILTNISARHIWEYLKDGKDLGEILDRVPDEFINWVRKIEKDLTHEFRIIECDCMMKTNFFIHFEYERKEVAKLLEKHRYRPVIFQMLDGNKDRWQNTIWNMLKPGAERPFK